MENREGKPARGGSIGHVAFLVVVAVAAAWYLNDVHARSRHVESTLLVSIVVPVLLFYAGIELVRELRRFRDGVSSAWPADPGAAARVGALMGMFAVYVLSLPWLGFDVGTFLYIGISLLIQGRGSVIGWVLAALVAMGSSYGLKTVLPYDVPTVLF